MIESSRLRELRLAQRDGQQVIAVHYACESLVDAKDHPAAVSCIGVADRRSGARQAFSLSDLPGDKDIKEREQDLLDRFYEHLSLHREALIVHWNMNSSTFGFAALENRYRHIAGRTPSYTPSEHLLYDLDGIIGQEYGETYVPHQKFHNLAILNEVSLFSYLPGREEASRFKSGDFGAIAASVMTKARSILDILKLLLSGKLRTLRSAGATEFAGARVDAVDAVLAVGERLRYVERELARRHNKGATLKIENEYDVQDLLRAVFALFFEDVREESWTPSYAGSASRIDFLIPAFELAIEVKMTRPSMTSKSLGDELIIDRDRYKSETRAKHLICLVFDYNGLLPNPRGLEADLTRDSTVEGLAVTVKVFDR